MFGTHCVLPSRFLCLHTNSLLGLLSVSQASVCRIRKKVFSNVDVKKSGCMFSNCTKCELLKDFIQKAVKGSDDWFSLRTTLNNHFCHQELCRPLYHSWRHKSIMSSSEFMCIIHDRIDISKTALLRLRIQNKMISGLSQLPVNLTVMVTHGVAPKCHLLNNRWRRMHIKAHNLSRSRLIRLSGGQPAYGRLIDKNSTKITLFLYCAFAS